MNNESSNVSRRSLLKTLGMGALVVGFNTDTGVYVTGVQASESGFEKLPLRE